jgi:hypothetical protein
VFFRIGWFFAGYFKLLIELQYPVKNHPIRKHTRPTAEMSRENHQYGETLDQQLEISCEKPSNTKKHSLFSGYCKLLIECFFALGSFSQDIASY